MSTTDYIRNRLIDEIEVGDEASFEREWCEKDIRVLAALAGAFNPLHMDRELAVDDRFQELMAHGMWGACLVTTLIGTELPGPGTKILDQRFAFSGPIRPNEKITVHVTVVDKDPDSRKIRLACRCLRSNDEVVLDGEIDVIAPQEKYVGQRGKPSGFHVMVRPDHFPRLEQLAKEAGAVRTGVVFPVDEPSLKGATNSAEAGLLEPVLIGPVDEIEKAADEAEIDLSGIEIIAATSATDAAKRAASLARDGNVAALMKGALRTEELMAAIVDVPELLSERRISHVFAMDVPNYDRLIFISDAAINVRPNLNELRDIVQNAIDLVHILGLDVPKVALLSAVETVTEKLESTMTAAALCKMAERGEITGAELDGPLALDNAVCEQAARIKGISSSVAGNADILIVPDLVSGNILAKSLDYLASAEAAGIVLGAKIPIALSSRADSPSERLASAALACLVAAAQRDA